MINYLFNVARILDYVFVRLTKRRLFLHLLTSITLEAMNMIRARRNEHRHIAIVFIIEEQLASLHLSIISDMKCMQAIIDPSAVHSQQVSRWSMLKEKPKCGM